MPSDKRSLLPRLADPGEELVPFSYEIAYGSDTAARPGWVMLRISRNGKILAEEHMPPEEFLGLAHGFENVARAVQAEMDRGGG